MADGNGAGVTADEVEALRQQLETLQVRHRKHGRRRMRCQRRRCTAADFVASPLEQLVVLLLHVQATLKKKEAELDLVAPYSRSYGRTLVNTILGAECGGLSFVGQTIRVGGWVKTGREAGAGAFAFLEVNDGSCFPNVQVGH
jgi:asparaginyl-tRNA synthetase